MEVSLKEIIHQLSIISLSMKPNIWIILTAIGTIGAASVAVLSSLGIIQRLYHPKAKIITGDRVTLVISSDKKIRKIHLPVTIINKSFLPITIRKIILKLNKNGKEFKYNWNLFVKPYLNVQIGLVSVPERRPAPFAVSGRSSDTKEIEFFSSEPLPIELGDSFTGKVGAWIDVENISTKPGSVCIFNFEIDPKKSKQIIGEIEKIGTISYIGTVSIPIKEWSLGWEENI